MDFEQLKTALNGFKTEVLEKVKADQTVTAEKIASIEEELDTKIKTTIDAEMAAKRLSIPGLEGKEKKDFHFHKLVRAQVAKSWEEDAGFEKEVCAEAAKLKSTNVSSGEAGGFLVPDEYTGELVDLALAQMPIMELGPTVYKGLRGNLSIPKLTSRPTAYFVGEEEAATESNIALGEINLAPKRLRAFTKISKSAIYQSSNLAEQVVREQLTNSMALGVHAAMINGKGAEKAPKGIVNYAGLTSSDAIGDNGGRFTIDHATGMISNIEVANMVGPTSRLGFLMHPRNKQGMKTERVVQYSGQAAAAGMPVMNPFVTDKVLEDLLACKIRTTTLVPATLTKGTSDFCSYVIYGAWEQLILAIWEGMTIRASDTAGDSSGSAFTQDQVWLAAFQSFDVGLKNALGFTVISDAETRKASW